MPKPLFQPHLVNGPLGDPVVYVDFQFQKRALLFDIGDIRRLAPRKILRLTDIFVSHTHMDHFNDFDWLIRLTLGRDMRLRLFGPPGFIDSVDCRLRAYTWNLVHNYEENVRLEVTELHPGERGRRAEFRCQNRFGRENEEEIELPGNVLVSEPAIEITGTLLDHGIPCLACAVQEARHVNVWKNRLHEMGLGPGPWLAELKQAVLEQHPDEEAIQAEWKDNGEIRQRILTLGELRPVVEITPGQKIAYVVDCAYTEANRRRIVDLIRGARTVFMEAAFLHEEAGRAADRSHLTAHQAGTLAREGGVEQLVPLHFSPRYTDGAERLQAEAQAALNGDVDADH